MSTTAWVVGGALVAGAGVAAVLIIRARAAAPVTAGGVTGSDLTALGEKKLGGAAGVVQRLDTFGHTTVCQAVGKAYGAGTFTSLCAASAQLDLAHYASQSLEGTLQQLSSGNIKGAVVSSIKSGYEIPKNAVTGVYHAITSIF